MLLHMHECWALITLYHHVLTNRHWGIPDNFPFVNNKTLIAALSRDWSMAWVRCVPNATETQTTRGEYKKTWVQYFSRTITEAKVRQLSFMKKNIYPFQPVHDCYDEISLVANLACSLLKPLTCQDSGMASIVRPHLSDVRTIGNRWAFNCIFCPNCKIATWERS